MWTDELVLGNRELWHIQTMRTITLLSRACFVFKSFRSHYWQMQCICCLSYADMSCSLRTVISAFTTLRGVLVSIPFQSIWGLWWEVALHQVCFFSRVIRFLISNFRRVLYVVCFLLGNSPTSEFYIPTFRNTLFQINRQVLAYEDGTDRVFRNVGI
jgi:hypothetical protein